MEGVAQMMVDDGREGRDGELELKLSSPLIVRPVRLADPSHAHSLLDYADGNRATNMRQGIIKLRLAALWPHRKQGKETTALGRRHPQRRYERPDKDSTRTSRPTG